PMDIYARPSTRYVAQFVGSPMNFLPVARIESGPDGAIVTTVSGVGLQTSVPSDSLPGANLTLGLRPENLTVSPHGT
ncbi:ABC transporter ATP-binding protein, partial [Rhizobium ruizarguesonis]